MRSILLAIMLASISLAVTAEVVIYKWSDEKGVTHYGEAPPANVKAVKAGIRPDRPAAGPGNAAQVAQKTQEDKVKAERARNCRSGLAQITALQSTPQHYVTNAKGERVFSSDGSAERKTVEAQKIMRKNCD
jgi:hypothetical protein